MVVRACGERVAGGIYLSVPTSKIGQPVDHFLIDPPVPIVPGEVGLAPIGVTIIEIDGVYHVLDIVGSEHYLNVTDFVEETRRLGVSRRIAKNCDFGLLTKESQLVLLHRRAIIVNRAEYYRARPTDEQWCPKDREDHLAPCGDDAFQVPMCASLWWEDVEQAEQASAPGAPQGFLGCSPIKYDLPGAHMHRRRHEARAVVREMPTFRYRGLARPEGVKPTYQLAIFARFSIGRIEVVRDPEGLTHIEAMKHAAKANIEVREVDE